MHKLCGDNSFEAINYIIMYAFKKLNLFATFISLMRLNLVRLEVKPNN